MRRKLFSLLVLILIAGSAVHAREDRNIFRKAYDALPDKSATFRAGATDWFPYPAYADRKAWADMMGDYRQYLIKVAEKKLDYEFQYIPASMYLEYDKTHDRRLYQPSAANAGALSNLFLGEMAEGKGRFIPKIIDGLYLMSEAMTWSHPQHTVYQKSKKTLPDPDDRYISLLSAEMGAKVAVIWYFLHDEFDKIDPSISRTVLDALDRNIFDPYLDESKKYIQWWLSYGDQSENKSVYNLVNNWDTYCNTYVTTAFLLAEQDQGKLDRALAQATWSVDKFMDYVKMDGACEEGPSYWNMAGAKAYEFAKILSYASKGAVNLLGDPQLRRMGEWRSAITAGGDWLIAFGDGFARDDNYEDLVYKFGKDVGSEQMVKLAIYMLAKPSEGKFTRKTVSGDLFRGLETLKAYGSLKADEKAYLEAAGGDYNKLKNNLSKDFISSYYADTEFASLRNSSNWLLGVKGGNNGESHNHNDLGSGALFIDECPVIIDPGVSTYGPRFYEGHDHANWNKTSEWHNTPSVNGEMQKVTRDYYATGSACDLKKNMFRTDIAHAYGEEACCKKWVRSYVLGQKELAMTDEYEVSERKAADIVNFIFQGYVYLPGETVDGIKVKAGEVIVSVHDYDNTKTFKVRLTYPKSLTPTKEVLKLKDPRFVNVWGDKIERLMLSNGDKAPLKGKYSYKLTLVF